MDRWEYFVRLDEQHDWARRHSHGIPHLEWTGRLAAALPDGMLGRNPGVFLDDQAKAILQAVVIPPTADEVKEWDRSVFAMRSVSRRKLGYRPSRKFASIRPASITQHDADELMKRYVEMTSPKLDGNHLSLVPTLHSVTSFGVGMAVLWEAIFASMVPGFAIGVCRDCGAVLPTSKTLRKPSRAARCKVCYERYRKANLTPEQQETRRKQWAKYKKEEREMSKQVPTRKGK